MTDLTSLGFPSGFHLGFSATLWWIYIIVTTTLGIRLYLNARKSDLINVKEMLRAKSILYICMSIASFLTQTVVFFPDMFSQFYFSGLFLASFSAAIYFYYWEKNLTTIKRIPTIFAGISTVVIIIGLITSIFFPDLPKFLWDFLSLPPVLLVIFSFILYIYLIYVFSKNVKGVSPKISIVWMGGMMLSMIALFFENLPGVKILPTFVVFYVSPLIFISGNTMVFYGITKLFPHISSFYSQTQRCAVHRGIIEKGNPLHYCPFCGIVYCEACFNQVIVTDGCWNCRKGVELENEKKQIIVEGLDLDKTQKFKDPNKKVV
ncbi:hypothetical protein LCGC14_1752660 [marine sediment metagenome]|uniref:Uncharacterized protein n=1 Tax=marine sediment metagenome TaxID=412755 RepID=A0A0F9K2V2_9ZZZZ